MKNGASRESIRAVNCKASSYAHNRCVVGDRRKSRRSADKSNSNRNGRSGLGKIRNSADNRPGNSSRQSGEEVLKRRGNRSDCIVRGSRPPFGNSSGDG